MKKISVIIPVYNVEKYIEECIKSVLNQSFRDLEIICVDDCGQDKSIKIIEELAKDDERIKIIHHSQNRGLAPARNTGMQNAEGDYIFFLDSDDYILPDTLEKLYTKIEETNSDFVCASSKAFADNPDDIELVKKAEKSALLYQGFDRYKVTADNLEQTMMKLSCVAWGKLYRKKKKKDNKLLFIDNNATFEDNGFHLKVLSCLPVFSTISNIGVMYRIRTTSITSNMDKDKNRKQKMLHVKDVMDDALEYIEHREGGKEIADIIRKSNAFGWYFKKPYDFIFRYVWGKNNKIISIFSIPLLREKILKDNRKVLKILGIPLSYSNLDNSVL